MPRRQLTVVLIAQALASAAWAASPVYLGPVTSKDPGFGLFNVGLGYSAQAASGNPSLFITSGAAIGNYSNSVYNPDHPNASLGVLNQGNKGLILTPTGFTTLPSIDGLSSGIFYSRANAINAAGVIAGFDSISLSAPSSTPPSVPVLFKPSGSTYTITQLDISGLPASTGTSLTLNSAASSAGYVLTSDPNVVYQAIRWNADGSKAALLQHISRPFTATGTQLILDVPVQITSSNVTFGNSSFHASNTSLTPLQRLPIRWDAAGNATELQNLGVLNASGYTQTTLTAANDVGQSVGITSLFAPNSSSVIVAAGTKAVKWDAAGNITALNYLGTPASTVTNPNSSAVGINAAGTVIGNADRFNATTGARESSLAVTWAAGSATPVELPTLGVLVTGGTSSTAYSINDAGQIVGAAAFTPSLNHAVLWQNDGTLLDLNTLLDPSVAASLVLTVATSISPDGWITGIGTYTYTYTTSSGSTATGTSNQQFLLQVPAVTVVPEPTALALLAAAPLALTRRRRA